ncbi:peptidoglycan-binding domain-containing protein [Actinacidiphila acidipaludis]|uniref:Peptidoglycan-binding protein n=1 Tax=Actinacidiphila acidipaludis TaxID=2873382 RepID=A0ABS7Q5W0_9ACTN|nr:peptidoglycan-binding domain-containing protein [Streptomyces acidipaludis]MBY8877815.1 peptidoglycan-binding protein [Streptomyces acidipaludis]
MAPQHRDEPDTPSCAPGQEPETAVQDGGEERATERSAARAADVAATEGFHPLRLRPYVAEPGAEQGESTVRRLLHAEGEAGGPDAADLGLFTETAHDASAGSPPGMSREIYSGLEYPADDLDDLGDLEDAADLADHEGLAAGAGLSREEAAAYAAARRGRHRRRRRRLVVAAAAVAASALAAGAVAVTGQVMSDEHGANGQALPDLGSSSVPDVTLPPDASPAAAKAAAPLTQESGRAGTPTRPTPSAPASTTPAPSAGTTAPGTPATGTPASGTPQTPSAPPVSSSPQPPGTPAVTPAAQVLQMGDSGPAVEDLQHRLAQMWIYHGPVDGIFDQQVRRAVATFQLWYQVSDEPDGSHDGVYGPNTRAALERQTSGI